MSKKLKTEAVDHLFDAILVEFESSQFKICQFEVKPSFTLCVTFDVIRVVLIENKFRSLQAQGIMNLKVYTEGRLHGFALRACGSSGHDILDKLP